MSTNAPVLTKTPLTFERIPFEYGTPEHKAELRRIDLEQGDYLRKVLAEDPTLHRFLQYYMDAGNWGGTPLVGGNVGGDAADKGFIVNMKKRGWISTSREDGCVWMHLEDEGNRVLLSHGIDNSCC